MPATNPLIGLYGDEALDLVITEIKKLASNSNVPFDKKYTDLGISFLSIKVNEIVSGKKEKITLQKLVSESFGEAAIYKYNVKGGTL